MTIAITGCVWYVSNNAAGNAGTSSAPFDTLVQVDTATPAGDTIFVFDGDNTATGYATGVDLVANQRLIGEAVNLVVGSDTLHTGVAANRPTLTDNNADVVILDDNNTVSGLDINPQGTGGGIAGGAGDASGPIADVRIVDNGASGTQAGLELDSTTGTFNISNLTVDNDATGVLLVNAGTVNFAAAGTISITSVGAKGLDASGASTNFGAGSVFDDITVTGSGTGAVSLTATTGSLTLGDGSDTDLSAGTVPSPPPARSPPTPARSAPPPSGSPAMAVRRVTPPRSSPSSKGTTRAPRPAVRPPTSPPEAAASPAAPPPARRRDERTQHGHQVAHGSGVILPPRATPLTTGARVLTVGR